MKTNFKTSLIIATYNWPEALTLTLNSVLLQKELPDEILIADDGSKEETRVLIEEYKRRIKVPFIHVWHEDKGFRLAEIRNKAIAKATGDYIVQIDGDVIMHPYFIKDHNKFAKRNTFVRASRIYLDTELSKNKLDTKDASINIFAKGVSNFFSSFRFPLVWKYFEKNYKVNGDERWEIHGCNMAFWRADAIKVNGYNESFYGWGPEDKEFVARLLNSGVEKRFLKLGGVIFHIDHPINEKEFLGENLAVFESTKTDGIKFCEKGINKYL